MKKWSFGFRVKEWFLTPRHWDKYYEAGDSCECVTMFYADSPDEKLAMEKMHKNAEEQDIKLEILGLEYKQEVDVPMPQQPIRR